jgi:hypothetical protein
MKYACYELKNGIGYALILSAMVYAAVPTEAHIPLLFITSIFWFFL